MNGEKGEVNERCVLCNSAKDLQQSHIIPAFVFRWLRDTSGTGHIRNSKNPNLRVQDGVKIKLLCSNCEGLLNSWETPFSKKVFYSWCEDPTRRLPYGEWMLKFAVSLSWRSLQLARSNNSYSQLPSRFSDDIIRATETWARFLRGELPHPSSFEQHLLAVGPIQDHTLGDMPSTMNRYLLRAIDLDIGFGTKTMFTYTKLGPLLFFGFIPNHKKWEGTKIHVRDGFVQPRNVKLPIELMDYISSRAKTIHKTFDAISDKQRDKMESIVRENPRKFMSSKQFDAMLEDYRMFGESAIVAKKNI